MGIVVACRCGQAFEADAWLAGKVVQCPVCRSPLVVTTPAEAQPVPHYRPVSAVSRESRETAESIGTFLVAGVVIFVAVLGLSVGIVGYFRYYKTDFSAAATPPSASPSTTAQGAVPVASAAGPVPLASPTAGSPIPLPAATGTPVPQAAPASAAVESPRAPLAAPAGWEAYEHSSGNFSVVLPAPPDSIERETDNTGVKRTVHILQASANGHDYQASREYRPFRIEKGEEPMAYAAVSQKRAEEICGSIVRSENVQVDDQVVCDCILKGTVDGAEVRQYLRIVVRGDTLFELSCRVPPGKERAGDIGAFLANYRLD